MKYSTLKETILALAGAGHPAPAFIQGAPGGGKTSLCLDVAESLGIPRDDAMRTLFRPSLHDPVDLIGVPHVVDGATHWAVPSIIREANAQAEKHGRAVLIWDELPQAATMMQNAIAGALLDRRLGDHIIHPSVLQVATGNDTTHNAGANRILTQLGNRVMTVKLDFDIDELCMHLLQAGIDPVKVAFLRYRPELANAFDPSRHTNPTPRSWDAVFRLPDTLPEGARFEVIAGLVHEGPAAEYMAFVRAASALPSKDDILTRPDSAPVPNDDDPGAQYAAAALAVSCASIKTMPQVTRYVARLPKDLQMMFYMDAPAKSPEIRRTSEYINWATSTGVELLI